MEEEEERLGEKNADLFGHVNDSCGQAKWRSLAGRRLDSG